MTLLELRSATITEKGQIAIPRELRKHKGFKEGSKIAIIAFDDRIELRPMLDAERMFCALMSEKSLSEHWNSKEDERAWKDL